jgi:hypothetical protein
LFFGQNSPAACATGPFWALYWARMSDLPASQALYDAIRTLILSARQTVARGVDLLQVHTNYEIGRRIVEQEQQGAEQAQYGKEILRDLAARLTAEFGKGFSRSNLEYMRRFYLVYPDRSSRIIPQTASGKFPVSAYPSAFPISRRRLGNPPRPTRADDPGASQMGALDDAGFFQTTPENSLTFSSISSGRGLSLSKLPNMLGTQKKGRASALPGFPSI